MAKLNGPFSFSGSFGGISFYKRRDIDSTIARTPSTLTKERIYADPAFENSLRNADEGGGRSKAAKMVRRVLHPLEPVRVGNWQASLTKALTPVQHKDSEGAYGQRRVLFSRHGHILDGLCLSSRTPFEGLVRNPVHYTLSKERLQAEVVLPALLQGVNFFVPPLQSYFRWTVVLGVVPDLVYTQNGYQPVGDYSYLVQAVAYSDWYPVQGGAPATTLLLQLTKVPPNDSFGLVLAVGILFGAVNQWDKVAAVKYQGSGRIVAVV